MLTFSSPHRSEGDYWTPDGLRFTDSENVKKLQTLIDAGRFLVAEHWHYRGARAPDRIVVEYYDAFVEYLRENAIAGDIVDVFDLSDSWANKGESVVTGKCPDKAGEVPRSGAY